ncbi:MAG TPA: hypothetical protein VEL49_11080 [Ktedonobacteraceae bacterium]|nr:hypothetical protein [Ktedonobacteraceae bacterium]
MHVDTTSFSVSGAYEADPEAPNQPRLPSRTATRAISVPIQTIDVGVGDHP